MKKKPYKFHVQIKKQGTGSAFYGGNIAMTEAFYQLRNIQRKIYFHVLSDQQMLFGKYYIFQAGDSHII